jgi:hypothetical protein
MPSGAFTALGVGHAAIKLETKDGQKHYITWSAQGNPLAAPLKIQNYPRFKHLGTDRFGYQEDKHAMEGFFGQQEPHFKIKLPVLNLTWSTLTYGVSASRIEEFWEKRLHEKMYAFFSARYNCTGCVWEALKAGGLGYYHGISDSIFIQGAAGLLEAVNKAKGNLDQLNDLQHSIAMKMLELQKKYPDASRRIPSLADWKKSSDLNVKFRAVAARKEQIAALDDLIGDYPNARKDSIKFVMLLRMQAEIYSHLTTKPNSDRKKAVERLGASVTEVINRLPKFVSLDGLSDSEYGWAMNTFGWRSRVMART